MDFQRPLTDFQTVYCLLEIYVFEIIRHTLLSPLDHGNDSGVLSENSSLHPVLWDEWVVPNRNSFRQRFCIPCSLGERVFLVSCGPSLSQLLLLKTKTSVLVYSAWVRLVLQPLLILQENWLDVFKSTAMGNSVSEFQGPYVLRLRSDSGSKLLLTGTPAQAWSLFSHCASCVTYWVIFYYLLFKTPTKGNVQWALLILLYREYLRVRKKWRWDMWQKQGWERSPPPS